jgi:hypothetical protein
MIISCFQVAMYEGLVDGFEFCATVISVGCFCKVLIHVSRVLGCIVLRSVIVCLEKRSWSFMFWKSSACVLVVTGFCPVSFNYLEKILFFFVNRRGKSFASVSNVDSS